MVRWYRSLNMTTHIMGLPWHGQVIQDAGQDIAQHLHEMTSRDINETILWYKKGHDISESLNGQRQWLCDGELGGRLWYGYYMSRQWQCYIPFKIMDYSTELKMTEWKITVHISSSSQSGIYPIPIPIGAVCGCARGCKGGEARRACQYYRRFILVL